MNAPEIVTELLLKLKTLVKVGITTKQLDEYAERFILDNGGIPFNKNYKPTWATTPYPATLCTSINSEIAHGIPSDYVLRDGDLLNIDVGVKKDGECADAAFSMGIGNISNRNERLLRYAKKTLWNGMRQVKAETTVREISNAIELMSIRNGYVVNKNLAGHGIGSAMHENPVIPNWVRTLESENDKKIYDYKLKVGQRICIEPQLTYGDCYGVKMSDGWAIRTVDIKNSAFFETMLEVTKDGYKELTKHINWNEFT